MSNRNMHDRAARRVHAAAWRRAWRALPLACAAALLLALGACATSGNLAAPSVQQLTTNHYAPTQTVDVLSARPTQAFESIARLHLVDPTGVATRSQLVAQLTATAKGLGANALVIEDVSLPGSAGVSFNPAGGQMQGTAPDAGAASITALAIRYPR
jgi:hypothetical protein